MFIPPWKSFKPWPVLTLKQNNGSLSFQNLLSALPNLPATWKKCQFRLGKLTLFDLKIDTFVLRNWHFFIVKVSIFSPSHQVCKRQAQIHVFFHQVQRRLNLDAIHMLFVNAKHSWKQITPFIAPLHKINGKYRFHALSLRVLLFSEATKSEFNS